MISYEKDPFLNGNTKNIYACLFNPEEDLKGKNLFLKTPTIEIVNKEKIVNLTREKFGSFHKGFLIFIGELERYLGIKYVSIYKTKYKFLQLFNRNKGYLVFLRVVSLCLSEDANESVKLFESFVIEKNYLNINNLKLPINNFKNRILYLVGVISGDGHLDKRGKSLIIVDGHSNEKKLILSKKYIDLINRLFQEEFNIIGKINKQNTWWICRIESKWLCRFFNYYFEIPFGSKSDIIKLPKLLSGENQRFFWRGLMDTDGFAREQAKQISVKSNSFFLINQFEDFCNKNNINTIKRKEKNGFVLRILTESFLKYSELIGFSHPRKKEILLNYLREGPKYKVLKKANGKNHNLFKHLKPYKENVYVSFSKNNRKTDPEEIQELLAKISITFDVKITKTKRDRYNDHYYICSKKFTDFVKSKVIYDLPWQPLNNNEINLLSERLLL